MNKINENSVVISGLSGAFPNADNVREFMDKLFAKENLLRDVPYMPCKLGKMNNLDKFDAEFFNMKVPHRVKVMDPMARIILEKAYEALLDSGNNPVTLKGKNCGVFVGIHFLEAEVLVYDKIQKGASLAISRSFNANRISHWLGVHGPSFIVDSACSSTLLALEMGYKAIRNGECESALVGGCHLCLHPALLLHMLKVGALSPNSESRVFDKDASGFCKAEAIGMFYLQKAKDAKRIYAEIVNVRSNHDGEKPLFLSPSGTSQQKLLKMVYEEARIDPDDVVWIEAHSTGTLVGDKQEVSAIDAVFANRTTPLLIGSVKSNMGHAEAAAGVSSLSKVIIAMETGFIPPNINIENVRTDIEAFKSGRMKVVTEKTPWNGGIVGVSGFGMGGANTHVVLKSFDKEKINHGIPDDFLPRIVGVSGRTEEAVEDILNYLEMTSIDTEFIGLLHQIHNHNIPSHPYRGYVVLHKNEASLIKKIEEFNQRPRHILFVYTNYLNEWTNIYRSLMEIMVFRTTIEMSADILSTKFGIDLNDILDNTSSSEKTLFKGFISAATIQIALTDLMKSLQIIPNYVAGYSMGELVCAYADGCLSLAETLSAVYYCAAYLSEKAKKTEHTFTVVIDKSYGELKDIVPASISLTFPSIVSGPTDDVNTFLIQHKLSGWTQENMKRNELQSYMPSINEDQLAAALLQKLNFKPKSDKWIISSAESIDNTNAGLCSYIAKTLSHLPSDSLLSKIDHYSVAVQFLKTNFFNISTEVVGETITMSLTDEDRTVNTSDILSALGELYLCGVNPQFDQLYRAVKYPVSRGTKMIAPLIKWKHTASWPVAFSSFHERMLAGERKVAVSLDEKEHQFIAGHEIDSQILYPGTGYVLLAWETLALIYGKQYTDMSVVFEHVRFHKAVKLSKSEAITFNVMVRKGNGDFEILEKGEMIVSGRVYVPEDVNKEKTILTAPVDDDEIMLDGLDFYRYILIRGFNYKDLFRSVQRINSRGTTARVAFNGNWITYLDGILQLNMLDAEQDGFSVPVEIEKIVIDVKEHKKFINMDKLKTGFVELDAFLDTKMNTIQSAGVQIKGCVFHPLPPKLSERTPLVQKYLFTPFVTVEKSVPLKQAIYLFLHIVMDFYGQQNLELKIAEIVGEDSSTSKLLLSSLICCFLQEQPILQAELKAYFCTDNDFKRNKCDNFIRVFGKLPLGELVHVIACANVFDGNKLTRIRNSLHDNGFLIASQAASSDMNVPNNWTVCCNITVSETKDRYLLLRKKPELNRYKFKTVRVSSATFEWIGELQEALRLDVYERIILFAEGEPFNGILGFYNCLRLERNTEHVRCYFLLDDTTNSFNLESEFCRSQIAKDLPVNVYKDGEWGCYVRQPVGSLQPVKTYHTFLNMKSSAGKKQILEWCRGPMNLTLQPDDENLIHVYYAALNPTDVLLFRNRIAREAILKDPSKKDFILGMEFSGRNSNGVRFMGLRPYGCLSSFIQLQDDDILVNLVPNNWSMEDAATVPLAYYVAIYAMVVCGKIQQHSTILIHSASSIIGQAAINVAMHYGCKIFVTVDSIDEKIFMKDNYPQISNTIIYGIDEASFEYIINDLTEGSGVDIVLNARVDKNVEATVNCLSQDGKLIQIKKADLRNSNLNVNKLLKKNVSLHSALLGDIFNLDAARKRELKSILDEHIKTNAVKPLPRLLYCHTAIESAFEVLSSIQSSKFIVSIEPEEEELKVKPRFSLREARPRFTCVPDRTYVVCGGLGGMGMELINWLVNRGAKKIVVTSRQGVRCGSQKSRINNWKSRGVQFHISNADISKETEAVRLIEEANKLGHVGGIFNLAAVLKDKIFKNQTAENFVVSAAPKLHGTFNLDLVSRLHCPHLEQFVVFSSIACGYGNLGQTNYGMFNSTVERICEQRYEAKLPALAIEWGAVGNVGMLVSIMDGNIERSFGGCYMQPIKSCLEVLDKCLCLGHPIVSSLVLAEKRKPKC